MHWIILAAALTSTPCAAPEFRQLDYWVGEWEVQSRDKKIADSSIERILNDCVIFENYYSLRGYAGKSFSVYNAAHHQWEQRYVDSTGAVHDWTGSMSSDGLRFFYRHDGEVDRMTYIKVSDDQVRQLIESSTDEKSWKVEYNGLYIRKK